MARNTNGVNGTLDAEAQLEALQRKTALLRDNSSLEASHDELQQAAQDGELVCWRRCKVFPPDGGAPTWYSPGDAMPGLPPSHALLQPEKRLVTTRERWDSLQKYKRLSSHVRSQSLAELQAKLKHARSAHQKAEAEVRRLQLALVEAHERQGEALAEWQAHDAELRKFVEAAPA